MTPAARLRKGWRSLQKLQRTLRVRARETQEQRLRRLVCPLHVVVAVFSFFIHALTLALYLELPDATMDAKAEKMSCKYSQTTPFLVCCLHCRALTSVLPKLSAEEAAGSKTSKMFKTKSAKAKSAKSVKSEKGVAKAGTLSVPKADKSSSKGAPKGSSEGSSIGGGMSMRP